MVYTPIFENIAYIDLSTKSNENATVNYVTYISGHKKINRVLKRGDSGSGNTSAKL